MYVCQPSKSRGRQNYRPAQSNWFWRTLRLVVAARHSNTPPPNSNGRPAPDGPEAEPHVVPLPVRREPDSLADTLGDGWLESEPGIYYRVDALPGPPESLPPLR